ncbi:multiubiquitin domain-containing protein (plasmid) [Rhizobium sp. CB3060]|uniref:multiubiquitin domain-containing protein n=1 Tax=Rhizobium sp. CB3060 TaxID=3138255 RepID=UPI0021A8174F|nr:multiubiquitin domain-containing protein [Rhizobium tropici]UWU25439.1 multiubiquitin domain-containing protein [Rhizobium tropici]
MPHESEFKFTVDGVAFSSGDPEISGREIRTAAGLNPASDFVLIELGNATSRSVGLEELIAVGPNATPAFLAFRSDRAYSLTINERAFEWGAPEISASDIRKYAGIPEDADLFLDGDHDAPIENGDGVQLGRPDVQRIVSKPKQKVRIIVNTREKLVKPGLISFHELVALAFPGTPAGPTTSYTVSYRKGPEDRPEGTLIEGESVKVKNGMVFNVSATDKS